MDPEETTTRTIVTSFHSGPRSVNVASGAGGESLLPAARGIPQAVLFGEDISASENMQAIGAAIGSVLSTDAAGCLTYGVPAVVRRV